MVSNLFRNIFDIGKSSYQNSETALWYLCTLKKKSHKRSYFYLLTGLLYWKKPLRRPKRLITRPKIDENAVKGVRLLLRLQRLNKFWPTSIVDMEVEKAEVAAEEDTIKAIIITKAMDILVSIINLLIVDADVETSDNFFYWFTSYYVLLSLSKYSHANTFKRKFSFFFFSWNCRQIYNIKIKTR